MTLAGIYPKPHFGSPGTTDYWYNYQLGPSTGGINEAAALNVSLTILGGDGGGDTLGTPAGVGQRGRYASNGCSSHDASWVPTACTTAGLAVIPNTSAQRHLDGLNLTCHAPRTCVFHCRYLHCQQLNYILNDRFPRFLLVVKDKGLRINRAQIEF